MLTRRTFRIVSTLVVAVSAVGVLAARPTTAQTGQPTVGERRYWYSDFGAAITVSTNSTFTVEEIEHYVYVGEFHQGLRTIPLAKVNAITDVTVVDARTNQPLTWSPKQLDKTDPSSWGKYTTFEQNGNQNIVWYYDLAGATDYGWIIRYTVHGGISFGQQSDRLYWNIFTDFDVPIEQSEVSVKLPQPVPAAEIAQYAYRSNTAQTIEQAYFPDTGVFQFISGSFSPKEAFTVDVSWPHGIVSQAAFWGDFFMLYYGYLLGFLALLASIIAGFIWWLRTEKFKYGKGTIVPQYEPPQHLRPAMAEAIIKERVTPRGLAATVVDLAVRGYVKIEEDRKRINAGAVFFFVMLAVIVVDAFLSLTGNSTDGGRNYGGFFPFAVIIALVVISARLWRGGFRISDYILRTTKPFRDDPGLEPYEKAYLGALFADTDHFSTNEIQKDRERARKLHLAVLSVIEEVYADTDQESKAFEVGLTAEKKKVFILIGTVFVGWFIFILSAMFRLQWLVLFDLVAVASIGLWAFIKYEARLNQEGRVLKEEWLGFKLYLEVAEKYRLQNLTPGLFEKYLPYAMIFGIEKKWARAFEAMHLEPPSWYGGGSGSIGHATFSGGVGGSFSPSGFSSSFSSSFASSFGSSGGGGGGAGGGGAGGGGGGGGGGAS